jgi:hypothetical protein
MKINRRIFLGSTIAACTLQGKEIDLADIKEPGWGQMSHGEILSYKFELAEIEFKQLGIEHAGLVRYVSFPLEDKLIIKAKHPINYINAPTEYVCTECTYIAFNWQIKGLPFDIVDFLNTEMDDKYTRNYRNTPFKLSYVQTYVDKYSL